MRLTVPSLRAGADVNNRTKPTAPSQKGATFSGFEQECGLFQSPGKRGVA
jgi:hypothetical protein